MMKLVLVLALVGEGVALSWWWQKKEECKTESAVAEVSDVISFSDGLAKDGIVHLASNTSITKVLTEALGGVQVEEVESADYIVGYSTEKERTTVVLGPVAEILTNGAWKQRDLSNLGNLRKLSVKTTKPLDFFALGSSLPKFSEIPQTTMCASAVEASIQIRGRLNGDEGSPLSGLPMRPCDFTTFDDFVEAGCEAVRAITINNISIVDPPLQMAEFSDCIASHGAKVFDANGTRVQSLDELLRLQNYWQDLSNNGKAAADIWFVPSGNHFVWPTFQAGRVVQTRLAENRIVTLTTASVKPAVFLIDDLLNTQDANQVIAHNKPKVKPSEVGLVGRAGDRTRTSSNAWDTSSPTARALISRAFDLLKIDPHRKLEDGLQVLHYEHTQWYKPHVDFFTSKNGGGNGVTDDAFSNSDPLIQNGTNRFATVFLYLSDTEEGGETSFPLSTTHANYKGGRLTAPKTINTPGFIRESDAEWICNASSEALRVAPRAAKAVLFYSQRGDASLDPYSLHGSCPVVKGTKWAANLWVWNRPRDALDKLKAKAKLPKNQTPPEKISNSLTITFRNPHPIAIDLFWHNLDTDAHHFMTTLQPDGSSISLNSFRGHVFIAKYHNQETEIASFKMKADISDITIPLPAASSASSSEL